MCERCPVCGLKFQREAGYFLGAMYISFGLALVTIALVAVLLWAITGWWITRAMIWAVVIFLPLAPAISLFARVLWIYMDQSIDPERQEGERP
jgi:divalent metal cation (Fe/Co/Zn/Cd) transporter